MYKNINLAYYLASTTSFARLYLKSHNHFKKFSKTKNKNQNFRGTLFFLCLCICLGLRWDAAIWLYHGLCVSVGQPNYSEVSLKQI